MSTRARISLEPFCIERQVVCQGNCLTWLIHNVSAGRRSPADEKIIASGKAALGDSIICTTSLSDRLHCSRAAVGVEIYIASQFLPFCIERQVAIYGDLYIRRIYNVTSGRRGPAEESIVGACRCSRCNIGATINIECSYSSSIIIVVQLQSVKILRLCLSGER